MYSDEIQNWLNDRSYTLSAKEYIWLINESGSTQIDHVKYSPFQNQYEIWTNDGFGWVIQVQK